ncbi:MAG TPA: C40 family peptidase [Paludibacter sp.]|nr:C40 family peptidase [Paludibacter sp.]
MPFQKHYFILLTFIFSTFLLQAGQLSNEASVSANDSISNSPRTDYLSSNPVSITDSVINYGKQFLNRPYRYGSAGADTFDCSGFTSYVYRNFGYNLEHSSAEQAQQFDTVKRNRLKTGDLVFFAGSRKSKRVGHVGIVTTAGDDGKFSFIHASCDKGVTISSSEEPYYSRRFIKANRVIGGTTQLLAVASSVSDNANADFQTDNNSPVTYPSKKIKKTIPAKFHKVKSGETLSEIAEK